MAENLLWIAGALVVMGVIFWLPTMNTWFIDFSTAPTEFITLTRIGLIAVMFWCMLNAGTS